MIKTQIPGKSTRSTTFVSEAEMPSVGFFFLNGKSDALKIIANEKGIDTLIEELKKARKVVDAGRSYLPGDLEWIVSDTTIVAIEPVKYTHAPRTSQKPERTSGRMVLILLTLIVLTFSIIGVVSVFRAIF